MLRPTTTAAIPPTTRLQQGIAKSTLALGVGVGGHAAPTRTAAGTTVSATAVAGQPPARATTTIASPSSPKSWAEAVVGTSSSAGSGATKDLAQNLAAPVSSPAPADVAMSPAERFAEDGVEPAEDLATVPEEVDDQRTTKQLSERILKIERTLRDRRRQHGKAEAAVAAQIDEIASQQAILVELQAQADERLEQIQALQLEESVLSQRLAKLNPVQGDEPATGERSGVPELTPVQDAMGCLSKALIALQNYQAQSPEIQVLLSHFAKDIEQLQAAELAAHVPGQTTIQQSFAAQRAKDSAPAEYGPHLAAAVQKKHQLEAKPSVGTPLHMGPELQPAGQQQHPIQTQPSTERYDIASDTDTPLASGSAAEAIAIPAGGNAYGRAPRGHELLCKKCWAVVCKCSAILGSPAPTASDSQGVDVAMEAPAPARAPETAMVVWQPSGDRMQVLAQLRARNQQQQERALKRAEEATSKRHSPY